MNEGYIYKISHFDVSTERNDYPDRCYVGQHDVSLPTDVSLQTDVSLNKRFDGHKAEARNFRTELSKRKSGKMAKLHEAMVVLGIENFKIELLKTIINSDDNKFTTALEEQERHFILKYNSIKNGWNKVLPSGNKKRRNARGLTIAKLAKKNNIPQSTLRNRLKKSNAPTEEVIKEILKDRQKKPIVYSYGRKLYSNIKSIEGDKRINIHLLDKKTIERRIRQLKKSQHALLDNSFSDKIVLSLTDDIFKAKINLQKSISLQLPDGEIINGSIKNLHEISFEKYPKIVPKSYTTIQNRLSDRTQEHWTPEEAFGFQVPPNYREVKTLVERENYIWKPHQPTENVGIPMVVHDLKEIFISQNEFANEFKIKSDMVSDYLKGQLTPDQILKKFEII